MKRVILGILCCLAFGFIAKSQIRESMYGDAVKADVKMKYVYSFEEALKRAKKEKKLIFFNCFADWALPCHSMNKAVFSDVAFADWMDEHFVNLFIDVTTPEGEPLAEKYRITFQAHYLVLDASGEIVHRIVQGCGIPEFKAKLELALNPKTSLVGMTKRYDSGERGMKFLRDYALVLRTADSKERYEQVVNEFFAKTKPADWAKKENWNLFQSLITKPEGELYDFLISHKAKFIKNEGATKINTLIARFYLSPLYGMATGEAAYDPKKLLDISLALQKTDMPEEHEIFTIYEIAKLRGEGNIGKMLEVFEQKVPLMDTRSVEGLDFSLKKLQDLSESDRDRVVKYLTVHSERMTDRKKEQYESLIKSIVNPEGIRFVNLSFDGALKLAASEGKLLFVDCYTVWCGPCQMMSKQIFPQKPVGDFFNKHLVSLKMDMEKGEGKDIQKRYAVNAFPTMMLLDSAGRIVYKLLGANDGREFMDKIQRGMMPEACYYKLKERYGSGDRSVDFMPDYLLTMKDAGELDNPLEAVRSYLQQLEAEDRFDQSIWKLYESFVTEARMPEFQFLCENRKSFARQVGEEEINRKIEKIIFPGIIGWLKKEDSTEDMEFFRNLIEKAEFPEQFSLSYLNQIVTLYERKDFEKLLDFYENQVVSMTDFHAKLNLDVLLATLTQMAPAPEKARAVRYAEQCEKNADPKAVKSYRNLLQALRGLN